MVEPFTYGYQRTFFRKFGDPAVAGDSGRTCRRRDIGDGLLHPPRAVPARRGLGLFLHGAASFLLFGVAATLAIHLVLIGGAFVVDGAPPASASATGTLNKVLLSSAGARMAESSPSV
jgi:hypothetical protein